MKISLLVIRCTDIEISKEFYERFGLTFKKEKHGNGPEHYSCESEETVFELYPRANTDPQDNTRLGFKILDINTLISDFKIETTYDFNGKNIYVVKDPDGRKVEIS